MKVILADDHHLVRSGIRALLESITGVFVVAEAGDGREALDLIQQHRPDVALLDITMPGLNGLEVAARVRESCPRTRVIVLSMHAGETYVAQALRAGVAGYLLKDSAASDLQAALAAVGRGGSFLSPAISQQVVASYLRGEVPSADPLEGLSPRQREVLQLIAEGRSTKEIAADLSLSIKTVETHRAQIMERLGIRDVPGLVRFAIRAGLITPEG
jgi:DNA-binding NarL/FixJ family response regulator